MVNTPVCLKNYINKTLRHSVTVLLGVTVWQCDSVPSPRPGVFVTMYLSDSLQTPPWQRYQQNM